MENLFLSSVRTVARSDKYSWEYLCGVLSGLELTAEDAVRILGYMMDRGSEIPRSVLVILLSKVR